MSVRLIVHAFCFTYKQVSCIKNIIDDLFSDVSTDQHSHTNYKTCLKFANIVKFTAQSLAQFSALVIERPLGARMMPWLYHCRSAMHWWLCVVLRSEVSLCGSAYHRRRPSTQFHWRIA